MEEENRWNSGGEMKLKIKHAVVDITTGRKEFSKRFAERPHFGPCPEQMRVPITITGYIDGIFGDDDGTSQEFTVCVTKLDVGAT